MSSPAPPGPADPLTRRHGWLRHFLGESPRDTWPPGFPPGDPEAWEEWLGCARRHGLLPFLHGQLPAPPGSLPVPARVRDALEAAFLSNAARNALLLGELDRLLQALARAGLPVIVLKGAFLAREVYGHPGRRPMIDLDLLLPRDRLGEGAAVLQGMGYALPGDPGPVLAASLARSHHLPRLQKPPGLGVELHWTLASPEAGLSIGLEGLWERSREWGRGGGWARGLAPEDLLLHLGIHASQGDGFCLGIGLRPLVDVAAVVRAYGTRLDWPALVERAREWGAARRVFLVLRLAVDWTGAAVPDWVLPALEPPGFDPHWVQEAGHLLMARGQAEFGPGLRAALGGFQLLGGERLRWGGGRRPRVWRDWFPRPAHWSDNPWVEAGTPFSAANYLRHIWGRVTLGLRFLGYVAGHPREAGGRWRRLRREASLGRWLDQPE